MGAASKGGGNSYYTINVQGVNDTAAVEAAVSRAVDKRIANAVQVSRDGIPNNVQ